MFKRKRFLVEIDSDFLFKKVRKYVNVNIYVHLEFLATLVALHFTPVSE